MSLNHQRPFVPLYFNDVRSFRFQDNLELSLKEKTAALEKATTACQALDTRMAQIERAREEDQSVLGQEIQRLTAERENLAEALAEEVAKVREASEQSALFAERLVILEEAAVELDAARIESARREALLRDATQEAVSLQGDLAERDEKVEELQKELLQSQAEVSRGSD